MENESKDFLKEGMKQYQTALEMVNAFYKEITNKLHDVLEHHNNWGIFIPEKDAKIKSTNSAQEYAWMNATLPGKIENENGTVEIQIDWYGSKKEYPYYMVRFIYTNCKDHIQKLQKANFEKYQFYKNQSGDGIMFQPNPEDFNIEKDFEEMISEFIGVISK